MTYINAFDWLSPIRNPYTNHVFLMEGRDINDQDQDQVRRYRLSIRARGFAVSVCPDDRAWLKASNAQLAQKYVTEKLAIWQERLKLMDWRISVAQVRSTELKPKPRAGSVGTNPRRQLSSGCSILPIIGYPFGLSWTTWS